jgi:polar amino acid transport system substrate-binding protein
MAFLKRIALALLTLLSLALPATAQSDDPMVFGTVHRPPFADTEGDQITGFSIDLMRAIADEIGREVVFEPNERFGDMLASVRAERVDGAIANISITADRERAMVLVSLFLAVAFKFYFPKKQRWAINSSHSSEGMHCSMC